MNTKYFISVFNEHYPFERYILKEPKPINRSFDDILVTELFVPSTEIKVFRGPNGEFLGVTTISDIYIKCKCNGVEFRMALDDFGSHIVGDIVYYVMDEIGSYAWQSLYVEDEDYEELKEVLLTQRELISNKYGECKVKQYFEDQTTLKLLEV